MMADTNKRMKTRGADAPSNRQLRVAEMLRRTLADILARGDHFDADLEGKFITVNEVQSSPDLRVATVYIYTHGEDDAQVIEALKRLAPRLRTQVTKEVKLKYSPELRFALDDSLDRAEQTLQAMDKVARGQ